MKACCNYEGPPIHLSTYLSIYLWLSSDISVYLSIYQSFCTSIYIYMYTRIHTYIHTDIHTYIYTYTSIYIIRIHACMHTYIHAYIHMSIIPSDHSHDQRVLGVRVRVTAGRYFRFSSCRPPWFGAGLGRGVQSCPCRDCGSWYIIWNHVWFDLMHQTRLEPYAPNPKP